MRKLLFTLTASFALALSPAAFAQAKKKEPAKPAEPAAPAAPAAPAKPAADAKAAKPLPMNSRADEIDAASKSFTHVNKDGKKVKHVLTDTTEIKRGDAAAKFEDIRQGDMVAGLRIKKNADGSEYEVVKITKFGPPAKKADAKPADKAKAK
jgi:hypothetical protein